MRLILIFIISIFTTSSWAIDADNPWPEIRKQRLQKLLPTAMSAVDVDAWVIVCRENNNDPLAKHVGCENAGQQAAFLFYKDKNGFHSRAYSPAGEATALQDINLLDEVISVPRSDSAVARVASFLNSQNFNRIAINTSENNAQADGLSHVQYQQLVTNLSKRSIEKLVSSESLVYEYLAIKLPAEVEIMRKAAVLTAQWQVEAYEQVIVGKTTDKEIAQFLKRKMAEHGVTDGWAADQNPNVVSGTDRGHSHATDRVVQPGDVIQTDFGIRVYDTWVTDIQRFAYVLKPGETKVPQDIAYYWNSAKQGRAAAFEAMRPGATGRDVDIAQRKVLKQTKSIPVMWSTGHPVGYVAHDSGPKLGGATANPPNKASLKPLKEGMTFAFDGFHSWLLPSGDPKTISVEEMVVITKDGAEYLIPPQQDLILISGE